MQSFLSYTLPKGMKMGASREFTSESSLTDWLPGITWTASNCRQVSPTFPEFTVRQGVRQGAVKRWFLLLPSSGYSLSSGFSLAFLYLCFSICSVRRWTGRGVLKLRPSRGAWESFGEKQTRAIRLVIFASQCWTHLREKNQRVKSFILFCWCLRALSKSAWPHEFGQNIIVAEV